jgi:23S rRNA pseudouridine1911/1915/1917 synthase
MTEKPQKLYTFTIESSNARDRLDKTLFALTVEAGLAHLSRSRVQSLIKQGEVTVNGQKVGNGSLKTIEGDVIEVRLPDAVPTVLKPADIKLNIVYEDDHLLVINKQAGLTVHPGAGNFDDTLVNALIAHCGDSLSGIGGEQRPGIVHRLDKDTTGLMLVAKNDRAHKSLSEQIQTRDVKRTYHALVWNAPDLPVGRIEANIGRHPKDRKKMSVLKKSGKQAITHFKLVDSYYNGTVSLIECQLETGRTHQIRVHFEHRKMPLIGDDTYSGNPNQKRHGSLPTQAAETLLKFHRQALHSKRIAFFHPVDDELLEFEIDYPDDFKALLAALAQN